MANETEGGTWIDVQSNDEKGHVNIYDKDPRGDHDSIHINVDYKTGEVVITEKENGETTRTKGKCYLTTACMRHYKSDFDDNCFELFVLRWFRDNYVTKEDIELYYKLAPRIVKAIEQLKDKEADTTYDYIYDNIIDYCIKAIENGEYALAYDRYKDSVLSLKRNFVDC